MDTVPGLSVGPNFFNLSIIEREQSQMHFIVIQHIFGKESGVLNPTWNSELVDRHPTAHRDSWPAIQKLGYSMIDRSELWVQLASSAFTHG